MNKAVEDVLRCDTPIIVVGPGRCGSSTVAGLLHTQFGVSMGERFKDSDHRNPEGYWEDEEIRELSAAYLRGAIPVRWWKIVFRELIEIRQSQRAWGFKDPQTANLIRLVDQYLPRARYIRLKRDLAEVVRSLQAHYGYTAPQAQQLALSRSAMLDKYLPKEEPARLLELAFGTIIQGPGETVPIIQNWLELEPEA